MASLNRAALDRPVLADWIVHAVGLAGGLAGSAVLLARAAGAANGAQVAAVALYVAGLLAMLACSALYHGTRPWRRRDWLRRLDHAAIFVMIAGTYTPVAAFALRPPWDVAVAATVWGVAVVGVVLKLVQPRAIESISVALYLVQGWVGLLVAGQLVASMPPASLVLIVLGGLVYSGGVAFHLSAARYSTALWHGCVLLGAALHYVAIAGLIP